LCGWCPILAADFTSVSKRAHASGSNSRSDFLGEGLGMAENNTTSHALPIIPEFVYRINPAFDRYPKEASWIGKILASFGELEFLACQMAGQAIDKYDQVIRSMYRLRSTSSRLDVADALMRPEFTTERLSADYSIVHKMLLYCFKLRNQYAHCMWGDDATAGLSFADLQTPAEAAEGMDFDQT
jgi:hypothetical protein